MKSVDKQTRARIEELQEKINAAAENVTNVADDINGKIADLFGPLEDAVREYNDLVSEYNGVLDDLVSEIESYYDDKSEKWQEGERGQAYMEWKDNVEQCKLEEASDPEPPVVDAPDVATVDQQPGMGIDEFV